MYRSRLIILISLSLLFSCTTNEKKVKVDSKAVELNWEANSYVKYLENPDSCRKALALLDQATKIDSNCYTCYYNKLMFYSTLNDYKAGIVAINNLIRLAPNAHDLYLTGGMLYERITDSISSKKYFEKSLSI